MALDRIIKMLLGLFVFLLPWQTALILRPGLIGKTGTGLEGPWQYGTIQLMGLDLLVAALCVCVAIQAVRGARPPSGWWKRVDSISLITFLCIAAFSIAWSADQLLAISMTVRLVEGAFLYTLIRSQKISLTSIAIPWVVAGCIQALVGIVQFSQQEVVASSWLGMAQHMPENLGDSVVENSDVRWLRAYGSFAHPNLLGFHLAAAVLFAFWLLGEARSKWQSILLIAASALLASGLFFTFSRESWLGLLAGAAGSVCVKIFLRGERGAFVSRDSSRVSGGVVAFVACAIAIATLSAAHWEPLSARLGFAGVQRLEARSISERLGGFAQGAAQVRERLITGTGIGQYTRILFENDVKKKNYQPWFSYQPVHNTFLLVASELGVVGGIAFFALIAAVFIASGLVFPTGSLIILVLGAASLDHFLWSLGPGTLLFWVTVGAASKPLDKKNEVS